METETKDEDHQIETTSENDKPKTSIFASRRKFSLLLCIALYQFASSSINSMIAPFFPGVATRKGANTTIIGLVFACFPAVVCLSSPVIGVLIPKLGPNFVLLAGQFIEGGAEVLFGFVAMMHDGTVFITLTFLVRCVCAIGASATNVASLMLLSSNFQENITSAMSFTEVISGFGLMVGPPIGGLLYSVGGFRLPFIVFGSLLIVGMVPVYFILPSEQQGKRGEKWNKMALFQALKIPAVVAGALTATVATLGIGWFEPSLRGYLKPFSLNSVQIGFIFFIGPAAYALSAIPTSYIAEKWNKELTMSVGAFITAIGFFGTGPAPFLRPVMHRSLWLIGVSLAIIGIGIGPLFLPALSAMTSSAKLHGMDESPSTQGALSAMFTAFVNVGYIIGPSLGGFLVDLLKFPWSTAIFGFLVLFWGSVLLVVVYFEKRFKRNSRKKSTDSLIIENHNLSIRSIEDERSPLVAERMF